MAKNDKEKEIAVKKEEKPAAAVPSRMLSPLRAWEREIEQFVPARRDPVGSSARAPGLRSPGTDPRARA